MTILRAATLLTSFAAVAFAVRSVDALADLDVVDAALAAVLALALLRASVGIAQAVAVEGGGPT